MILRCDSTHQPPRFVSLPFGQQEALPGFSEWASRVLQESVRRDQCRYGKDLNRLLDPQTGISGFTDGRAVYLERYDEFPVPGSCFRGECGDLTYAVGKKLEVYLGSQAAIYAINGSCPDYFSQPTSRHLYLLAVPESVRNAATTDIKQGRFPEGAVIVDPSFNRAIPTQTSDHGYGIHQPETLENLAPQPFTRLAFYPSKAGGFETMMLPLGFLQEMAPRLGQQGLVFMNVVQSGTAPLQVHFGVMTASGSQSITPAPGLEKAVPPLAQFKNKLEVMLNRPTAEQKSDLVRYAAHNQQRQAERQMQETMRRMTSHLCTVKPSPSKK